MPTRLPLLTIVGLYALAGTLPLPALALAWPTRPVTLVVPFLPGGGNDLVARQIAPGLQQLLGQPVVVDNKPDAGGTLGVASVTEAAPDGYTLRICATGNVAVAPTLYSKLSYGVKDLLPVSRIVNTPAVWAGICAPVGAGAAKFGELIQRDAALWKKIVTDSHAQLD